LKVAANEAANILNNAIDRSLIILGELGGGTSRYYGAPESASREPT
jgi:DNA mismatch repair ATPase MutS